MYLFVQLTCFICAISSRKERPPRLVTLAAANTSFAPTNVTILPRVHRNAYLVNVSYNSIFSIQRPSNMKLQVVSKQAQDHDCNDVAVNGGPFQANGELVGGVVINGRIVSNDFQKTNVGFGYISSSRTWILGGLANGTEVSSLLVEHYVTGLGGWLVYQGKVVVEHENIRHGHERAPRTAVGVDHDGNLLLLVGDGCEACLFRERGMTLQELAETFQKQGVYHAINVDGGSSTTLVKNGSVINVPTCHDIVPWKCERSVATIVCLQEQQRDPNEQSDGSKEEEEAQ